MIAHSSLRTPPLVKDIRVADLLLPDRPVPLTAHADEMDGEGERVQPRPPLPLKRLASPIPEDLYWVPVDNLTPDDVVDVDVIPWVEGTTVTGRVERKLAEKAGARVHVGGEDIVVFRYRTEWFAVGGKCPHQGADLVLGDIEDVQGEPALRCPRHKWRFSLRHGDRILPKAHSEYCLVRFPLMIDPITSTILIGFPFSPTHLPHDDDF